MEHIKVCPKCKSTNVKEIVAPSQDRFICACNDCNYEGLCPEVDLKKLKKAVKK
jgi:hypothetical protein